MSKKFDLLSKKIDRKLDPDDIMLDIMEIYNETELTPEAGKHYTFVYSPKTSDIIYDEYPLVAVFSVERWGFSSQLSLGCNEKLHLGGDFWIFALYSERRYWKTSSRSIS